MRVRAGIVAALVALPLAASVLPPEPELPDLRRGQAAARRGDVALAERDLVPLAHLGYLEAQVALAGLYGRSEDVETLRKAVHWYRVALERDPNVAVPLARALLKAGEPEHYDEAIKFLRQADRKGDARALAGLIEFYTDHPDRAPGGNVARLVARASKVNSPETETAVIRWYRHNVRDDRDAAELARRCDKAKERLPDCFVDLARFYRGRNARDKLRDLTADAVKRHAAGGLPGPLLERMAWSMVQESVPGEPLPEAAYPLLKRMMGSSLTAQVRVARLQVEYPHLDPESNPEKILLGAVERGSTEAALALGRLYMNGIRVTADPRKAERYLQEAAATEPAAHYYLGRLYKRGELGESDPERAARHLLTAARGGYARADYLMAQLFSDGRGVRVNRVNALVFASLAARNGVPHAEGLVQQLRASTSAQERSRAEQILNQEVVARGPAATATAQRPAAPPPGGSP